MRRHSGLPCADRVNLSALPRWSDRSRVYPRSASSNLAGVVDEQHRDAAPAQPQQPVLDLAPGVAVVLAHAHGQAREVVEYQKLDAVEPADVGGSIPPPPCVGSLTKKL